MDARTLSDLIGLIYDTIFNIDLWPRLIKMLADELSPILVDSSEMPLIAHVSDLPDSAGKPAAVQKGAIPDRILSYNLSRTELLELLRSHFIRALAINHQISEPKRENTALLALFNRLPLGMMIIDRDGHVLTYNCKLSQIIAAEEGISIHQNLIRAASATDTKRLRQTIRRVADNNSRKGETVFLTNSGSTSSLSALVIPYDSEKSIFLNDAKVVVILATSSFASEICVDTLIAHYNLTKAEAKIVLSLVNGRRLNVIAKDSGLSKHTVRNQIKSVYNKTSTHSQAELVRQVITGPAMLATMSGEAAGSKKSGSSSNALNDAINSTSRHHQTIRLCDGRKLGFAEYGLENGTPVMLMHASGSSRLERHPDEAIVEQLGIRLIVPDRPGGGLSDPKPKRTLLDWAEDVSALADHLRLRKFSLIGISMGGPFALACAHRLGKRIHRMAIVAGLAPFNSIKGLEGMYAPNRLMLFLAKYGSILVDPLIKFTLQKITLEAYRQDQWDNLPSADKALVHNSAIHNRIMVGAMENLRHNHHNMFEEVFLVSCPWGFELADIKVPVEVWQGGLDPIAPSHMARKMAAELPFSRLHFLPEAGHYLIYHCWQEILLSSISEED